MIKIYGSWTGIMYSYIVPYSQCEEKTEEDKIKRGTHTER